MRTVKQYNNKNTLFYICSGTPNTFVQLLSAIQVFSKYLTIMTAVDELLYRVVVDSVVTAVLQQYAGEVFTTVVDTDERQRSISRH